MTLAFKADAFFGGSSNCPSDCDTCSDSSTCTKCKNSKYLHNAACGATCPTGYSTNDGLLGLSTGRTCELTCETHCETCSDSTTCTKCQSSKYLHNADCVSSCPNGYSEKGLLYGKTC